MQSGVLAKFDLKISTFKFCHFTLIKVAMYTETTAGVLARDCEN